MEKRVKFGGRKKGVPNKQNAALKEAILNAARLVGEDGAGSGGLEGYLTRIAREDIKTYAGLLGKVLPLQVRMEANVQLSHEQALAELAD